MVRESGVARPADTGDPKYRAIRAHEGYAELTPIGHAFLDLTGLDAVRWLLHVEATLSTGVEDVWRVESGHAAVVRQQA